MTKQGQSTLEELLHRGSAFLTQAKVDSPALSARVLAGHVLEMDTVKLVCNGKKNILVQQEQAFWELIKRRGAGEPVALLLGYKEFYGLNFIVNKHVLVPRPETEHLIEEALHTFPHKTDVLFADLGTGSGCLAVTLAALLPNAHGIALDTSRAALKTARENAVQHRVSSRIHFVEGDMTMPFARADSLDLILANPPYVSCTAYKTLSLEVTGFEPVTALVPKVCSAASATGLEYYAKLLEPAAFALRSGGRLIMEIGASQAEDIVRLIQKNNNFFQPQVKNDLAGRNRVIVATMN